MEKPLQSSGFLKANPQKQPSKLNNPKKEHDSNNNPHSEEQAPAKNESLQREVGPVEIAEVVESPDDVSATSTNPAPPPAHAVYPEDSALDDFMAFAREYSESEDSMLIGAVLPVVGRLLGRRVFIRFAGRKYANLYSLLVTKPGLRKSTNIKFVEKAGAGITSARRFHWWSHERAGPVQTIPSQPRPTAH